MTFFSRAALPALAALALAGCGLESMQTRNVSLSEMPCSGIDPSTGAWISHPLPVSEDLESMGDAGTSGVCAWMRFGARERLVVEHDLGRTPVIVLVYLAFQESGIGATLASGDIARIVAADADELVLENRTDESFYLRLVLE